MCGLIGGVTASTFNHKEESVLNTLFLVNSMRGIHGCGMFALYEQKVKGKDKVFYDTVKSEMPSSAFVYTRDYESFMARNMMLVMGHSRHATIGAVNEDNCHPFITPEDKIIGFHNGTVRGTFDKKKDFETDSEAIMNIIAEKGLKDTLKHLYEEAWTDSGVAYAFQIYDRKAAKIYLIRNKERPLHLAFVSDCCFWASERIFLMFALAKAGYDTTKAKFKELQPGELATINPWAQDIKEIIKFEENWFTPPARKAWYAGNNQQQHNKHNSWHKQPSWWESQNANTNSEPLKYFNIGGRQVSGGRLDHILNAGCGVCGTRWDIDNAVKEAVHITTGDEVICDWCLDTAKADYNINKSNCHKIVPVAVN